MKSCFFTQIVLYSLVIICLIFQYNNVYETQDVYRGSIFIVYVVSLL